MSSRLIVIFFLNEIIKWFVLLKQNDLLSLTAVNLLAPQRLLININRPHCTQRYDVTTLIVVIGYPEFVVVGYHGMNTHLVRKHNTGGPYLASHDTASINTV